MTQTQLNLMLRVISQRISKGEIIENIISSYPKLTKEELTIIKTAIMQLQTGGEKDGKN